MTEHSANDHEGLSFRYGSVRVIYDPEHRSWITTRVSKQDGKLRRLGNHELVVASSLKVDSIRIEASANSKSRSILELLGQFPELQPSTSLLTSAARYADIHRDDWRSEVLDSQNLLAFGCASVLSIRDKATSSRPEKLVPVIALAGGDYGEVLCLKEMRPCRQGWNDDRNSWLTSFDINHSASSNWSGSRDRIREIVFAEPFEETFTLVAVRYPTSVTILDPIIREPISQKSTRLDLRPICTLVLDSQELNGFASVSFNPWYQYQIATLDRNGRWKIWSVEQPNRSYHTSHEATIHAQGVVNIALRGAKNLSSSSDAGWFKVLWLGDLSTIVISSRTAIEIVNINTKPPCSTSLDFCGKKSPTIILDMKKPSSREDELFILTTTQLIFCRLGSKEPFGRQAKPPMLKVVSSWDHHRDGSDKTLRLGFREYEDELTVLLYSSQQNCVVEYVFEVSKDFSAEVPFSLRDPTNMSVLNLQLDEFTEPSSSKAFYFRPLAVSVNWKDSSHGTLSALEQGETKFFQLFTLGNDLSLASQLYYQNKSEARTPFDKYSESITIRALEWKISRGAELMRKGLKQRSTFVVSDDDISGLDEPESSQLRHAEPSSTEQLQSGTTANELAYLRVINNTAQREADLVPFVDELIHRLTMEALDQSTTFQTFASCLEAEAICKDVDTADSRLSVVFLDEERLTEPGNRAHPNVHFTRIVSLSHPALGGIFNVPLNVSSVYRTIIDAWLGSLPSWVSGKTRLAKERLARQVAASLCLASIAAHSELHDVHSEFVNDAKSELYSSQEYFLAHPTSHVPTPSTTPLEPVVLGITEGVVSRLQKYTSMNRTAAKAKEGISNVISLWTLGADPANYNHAAAIASQSGVAAIAGSAMTAEQRERNQRRLERKLLKEQRMGKRLRLDPYAPASQQPLVNEREIMSSQSRYLMPVPSSQVALSSQVTPGIVTSQIEPGRFGGRSDGRGVFPIRAKPRPARKAGF